jgi:FtsZ-binding cell division protein ZapB
MPKTTATRLKTQQIATQLRAEGVQPTTRNVRSRLGTGSFSTIADELARMQATSASIPAQQTPSLANDRPTLPVVPVPAGGVQSEGMKDVLGAIADLSHELGAVRAELAAQRADAVLQLREAYARYEAVQRQALLQVDAARVETSELRERIRQMSLDAQCREDALRGKAQQLREENQQLKNRIAELTPRAGR